MDDEYYYGSFVVNDDNNICWEILHQGDYRRWLNRNMHIEGTDSRDVNGEYDGVWVLVVMDKEGNIVY